MKKVALILLAVLMVFTLAACGGGDEDKAVTADVNAIWSEIENKTGEMPAFQEFDANILTSLYGIAEGDLVKFVGKMAMINTIAEEYLIAEVAEGKMEAVEAGINKRVADLENQWSQYLPDQHEKVKNHKIVKNGNYILFVIADDPQIAVDAFNKAFGK